LTEPEKSVTTNEPVRKVGGLKKGKQKRERLKLGKKEKISQVAKVE
jgi:hypothetical protein